MRVPSIPPDAVVPDDIDEEVSAALESSRDPFSEREPFGERDPFKEEESAQEAKGTSAQAASEATSEGPNDKTTVDATVGPSAPAEDAMSALNEEPAPLPKPVSGGAAGGATPSATEDEPVSIPIDVGSLVSAPVAPKARADMSSAESDGSRTPLSSSVATRVPGEGGQLEAPSAASPTRWPWIMAIALVSGGVLYGVQGARAGDEVPVAVAAGAPSAASQAADLVQSLPLTSGLPVATPTTGIAYEALPEGLSIAPGQGLLEANVGATTSVWSTASIAETVLASESRSRPGSTPSRSTRPGIADA
jgi:hypothetical protein